MMISPNGYVESCKEMSFEELIEQRDMLVEDLRGLEEILLKNDHTDEEWKIYPQPNVRYSVSLEYLEELCKFMREQRAKEIWD
jgi:hypothetical protein